MREFLLGMDDPRFYALQVVAGLGLIAVNTVVLFEHGWSWWRLVFYVIFAGIVVIAMLGLGRWVKRQQEARRG